MENTKLSSNNDKILPNNSDEPEICVIGTSIDGKDNIIKIFDERMQMIRIVGRMTRREWCSISCIKKNIYAIGGYSDCALSSVELFNQFTVEQLAPMSISRFGHCAAVLGNEIAVCGGYSRNSCEIYSCQENRWTPINNMKENRQCGGLIWFPDNKLYVFGGHNGYQYLDSVERIQISKHSQTKYKWQKLAPMLKGRAFFGAISIGKNIFVAGGYNNKGAMGSIEMFTLPTKHEIFGQWTKINSLKEPKSVWTLLNLNNVLYVFDDQTCNVERFVLDRKINNGQNDDNDKQQICRKNEALSSECLEMGKPFAVTSLRAHFSSVWGAVVFQN